MWRQTSFFIVALALSLGIFSLIYATDSNAGDIDACIAARKNGTAKTITDYICPSGNLNLQEIAFQVILSKKFKTIDDAVTVDLQAIYDGSYKDVGQLSIYIDHLFDPTMVSSKYPAQYRKVCDSVVVSETCSYLTEKKMSCITDNNIQSFLPEQEWPQTCNTLATKKINAYREVAWLLGEGAVVKSFQKDKHDYMRKLKDQYEKFLNKWTTYIGQLGVIKDKWITKTKKCQ